MTAAELAQVVGGGVEGAPEVVLSGAEVDSRRLAPGDLFVALPGERVDGHQFVVAALAKANAALVRHEVPLAPPPPGRALIRVEDPLAAYHHLAREVRARASFTVAALTGSVGKTTTKEFLAALLSSRFATGATVGNRNSTLGLPAELLSQPEDLEVFVAEAGMSRAGELDLLGSILQPELLLYTRIAPAHTEFFASMEQVAAAKAELLPHLAADGTLVLNADDPLQANFASRTAARVRRYGAPDAELRAEAVRELGLEGSRFVLVADGAEVSVTLPLPGRHQRENLLAAAAAATALGLSLEQVAESARGLRAAPHRGRVHRLGGDVVVVDDSYNASPEAMDRMLALLAASAARRRVAVLGEMYELGTVALMAHRQLGALAARSCDLLLAVGGELAAELAAAARDAGMAGERVELVEDAAAAGARLGVLLAAGDVVLVKGSRGVGLERVVQELCGEEAA